MKPANATIVLVGLCNEEPLLQTLIGTIVFRKNDKGEFEPQLINIRTGTEEGTNSNPFKPVFQTKQKGMYTLTFPGDDVRISLDRQKNEYTFLTGLNAHDSGTCGPLSNGGQELTDVLDEVFGF